MSRKAAIERSMPARMAKSKMRALRAAFAAIGAGAEVMLVVGTHLGGDVGDVVAPAVRGWLRRWGRCRVSEAIVLWAGSLE